VNELNMVIHPHLTSWCTSFETSRLLCQKLSIMFAILFWLMTSKSARACWGHRHIIWHSDFNFARTIDYEKATWVPCLLTVDHKRDCVTISKQYLEMFQRNPDKFLRRFTVNETSITSHSSRRNNQNNEFHRVNLLWRRRRSAEKVMATVFWDARDIIYINYLASKQMINDDYYAALLDCFNNIFNLAKKKMLFHQDNGRVHPRVLHRWPNSTNSATNCFPIQYICHILPLATISCF